MAEGINAMMPLVAILVVFGGFMGFDQNLPKTWTLIFGIIGTVVFALGVLGFFLIEETKVNTRGNQNYFANIFYGFRPRVIRENKALYVTLLAYAVFGISIQIFMPYLILYYSVSLGMENYVLIFAPAIILAAAFTAFYGRVYDRKGFQASAVPAMILLMAGYIVLYFFRSTVPVFLGTLIMLCGYLSGMAVFGAMLRDYTPKNKAGMFQGPAAYALAASSLMDANQLQNVVAFVDWLYSPKGIEVTNWGLEGESFEVDAEGNKSFKEDFQYEGSGLGVTGVCAYRDFEIYKTSLKEHAVKSIEDITPYATYPHDPILVYNEEEQYVMDTYSQALLNGAAGWLQKFILGKDADPANDADWDAYVKEMESLHIADLMEIHESAYARTKG